MASKTPGPRQQSPESPALSVHVFDSWLTLHYCGPASLSPFVERLACLLFLAGADPAGGQRNLEFAMMVYIPAVRHKFDGRQSHTVPAELPRSPALGRSGGG